MDLSFPWPTSQGEWLAWAVAAFTILSGLFFLFAPRAGLRFLRLQTMPAHPEALSESRGTIAGFYLGLGASCILLGPQPLLYMALGFSWAFTAFGRLVSMMSDRGLTLYNLLAIVLEAVLAALPLAYAFGFVA